MDPGGDPTYHTHVLCPFAERNTFGPRYSHPWAWAYYNATHPASPPPSEPAPGFRPARLPALPDVRRLLPQPFWSGHDTEIAAYWRVFELIFPGKLRPATPANRFVSHFCSTAFNDATFLWDSAFIARYGLHARRAWNFQAALDNFYAKQHPDGFICRELRESDGAEKFHRHDPSGTGPNVLPWAEWEHYLLTGDRARLERVFDPCAAYTLWCQRNRSWPDGSYWATGWSSGMDNQPRLPPGFHQWYEHGHQTWVDACFQAILAFRCLARIAAELGRPNDAAPFTAEAENLTAWCNTHLWDDTTAFYHDRRRDGALHTALKTIGAYWALPAQAVPSHRLTPFLAHLENPSEFNRPHRCPAISADSPGYDPDGGYWRGGVWPPANFMLCRGLRAAGRHDLAHQIALNHLRHVAACCAATGTLWETYAPDRHAAGRGQPDFTGWTGLGPVAMLFEDIFGLEPRPAASLLTWRVHLTDEFGVTNFPFGPHATLSLRCPARSSPAQEPAPVIQTTHPLTLRLLWPGGEKLLHLRP